MLFLNGATGKKVMISSFRLGLLTIEPRRKSDRALGVKWDLTSRETLEAYWWKNTYRSGFLKLSRKNPLLYGSATLLTHLFEGDQLEAHGQTRRWYVALGPVSPRRRAKRSDLTLRFGLRKKAIQFLINERKLMSPQRLSWETLNKDWWRERHWPCRHRRKPFCGMKARGCYETPGGTIMNESASCNRVD